MFTFQTADNPNYVLAGTYDFGQQGGFDGKTGILTKTVKATKVKITVKTGLGGFASCGEMEFFEKANYRDLNESTPDCLYRSYL